MRCTNCGVDYVEAYVYVYKGNSLCDGCYELARVLEVIEIAKRTVDSEPVITMLESRMYRLRDEVGYRRNVTKVKYPEII